MVGMVKFNLINIFLGKNYKKRKRERERDREWGIYINEKDVGGK